MLRYSRTLTVPGTCCMSGSSRVELVERCAWSGQSYSWRDEVIPFSFQIEIASADKEDSRHKTNHRFTGLRKTRLSVRTFLFVTMGVPLVKQESN